MEVFFLIPGTFALILPWLIVGALVMCAIVFVGIQVMVHVDERKAAKQEPIPWNDRWRY